MKLITYSKQVHKIASKQGHNLVWNVKDPACHIGICTNCKLRVHVTDDKRRKLTIGKTPKCKPSN